MFSAARMQTLERAHLLESSDLILGGITLALRGIQCVDAVLEILLLLLQLK